MNSFITIKWIHLLQFNEFIYFALQKNYELIYCVNLLLNDFNELNEFIYFALQKSMNSYIAWIHY